jgi:hypothetical protein
MAPGKHLALDVSQLNIASTAKLDLNSSDLIAPADDLASITSALQTGFNAASGYWNGPAGIVSSAAAADTTFLTTLGLRQSDGTPFDGMTPTVGATLVMYTYYGDADLNGLVNGADYQQIDNGFGAHLTGWSNGDFNYDGIVDGSDYSLIDNAYNQLAAAGLSSTPLAIRAAATPKVTPMSAQITYAALSPFSPIPIFDNNTKAVSDLLDDALGHSPSPR